MCLFSLNHKFRSLVSVCPPYLHTSISFKPGFAIIPVKPSDQQEQIRRLNLLCPERAGGREGEMEGGFVEEGTKVNCRGNGEGKDARKRMRLFPDIRQILWLWLKTSGEDFQLPRRHHGEVIQKGSFLCFWEINSESSPLPDLPHHKNRTSTRQLFLTFGKALSLLCTMRGTMEAQRESHAEIWSC